MKIFVKHYFDTSIEYMQEVFVEGNYVDNTMNIIETRPKSLNGKQIEITTFNKNFTEKELEDFINNTSFFEEQEKIYKYALEYMKKQNPKS